MSRRGEVPTGILFFGGAGPEGKKLHGRTMRRWEDDIKLDLQEVR